MYEGKDLIKSVKTMVKTFNNTEAMRYNKALVTDYMLKPKNGGIIGHFEQNIFFIKTNEWWKRKVYDPKVIDVWLNAEFTWVDQIVRCVAADRIGVPLVSQIDQSVLFVVWNTDKNNEVSNFSLKTKQWRYGHGVTSKSGFIFTPDYYVNLDYGTWIYHFEYKFIMDLDSDIKCGFDINYREDACIHDGKLILKETLAKVEVADTITPEMLINGGIDFNLISFSVDGSSVLHFFALDKHALPLIIEYLYEEWPDYL